ncbi:MAG: alpha/beta hydrolase family protein [Myxococcota bacterium]
MTTRAPGSTQAPPSRGLLAALRMLAAPAGFTPRPPTHADLPYRDRTGRGVAPLADVWLPEGDGPHPSAVLVHGGGFVIGSRRMKPVVYLATRLVEAGFAVAAFDYRLVFRGGRLDEMLSDVDAMMTWWRGRADRLGLDPRRIAMAGMSAGGALMWLHAAAAERPPERLVSIYGVYDLAWMDGVGPRVMRRLLTRSGDPGVWRARSAVSVADVPVPALLLHGEEDRLVPPGHLERLLEVRRAADLPTTVHRFPGEPHGFLCDASRPASEEAVEAIRAFLTAPRRRRGARTRRSPPPGGDRRG